MRCVVSVVFKLSKPLPVSVQTSAHNGHTLVNRHCVIEDEILIIKNEWHKKNA